MARTTGHKSDAMMAEQLLDKMYYSFNDKYWNEELKHYKSPKYRDVPDDRAQAMAILAGFVPAERYPIMREFMSKYHNASPYMEKYVLESLCQMGYYTDAMERMERRFGEMVAAPHTTLWEGWEYTGAKGMTYKSGNGTYNHAWSGGGLTILSQYIAGIAPVEPQFKSFSVSPNLANLKWLESVVPTRFGDIELRAERVENRLEMTLTIPQGTTAHIIVPQGYATLNCSNTKATKLTLESGTYNIIAE